MRLFEIAGPTGGAFRTKIVMTSSYEDNGLDIEMMHDFLLNEFEIDLKSINVTDKVEKAIDKKPDYDGPFGGDFYLFYLGKKPSATDTKQYIEEFLKDN